MDEILQKLNEEQIKPVMDTEGAVLVLAGAGSGKTRVLTSRIAYLVENKGAHPSSILAITFTNKAANEMKERLSAMIDGAQSMWICTIHSMCVRILRLFADRLGYNKNFSIYSETERTAVIKRAFAESGLEDEKLLKNIKFHIANAKMLGQEPDEYERNNSDLKGIREITSVYAAYCDYASCVGRTPLPRDAFYAHTVDGYVGSTRSRSALWLTAAERMTLFEPMCRVRVSFSDREGTFDSLLFWEHLSSYDWYPIFVDGNHPVTVIENLDAQGDDVLLLVKDSFANSLAPLLTPWYRKLVMVDPRYYRGSVSELCTAHGATELLFCYSLERIATDTNLLLLK